MDIFPRFPVCRDLFWAVSLEGIEFPATAPFLATFTIRVGQEEETEEEEEGRGRNFAKVE